MKKLRKLKRFEDLPEYEDQGDKKKKKSFSKRRKKMNPQSKKPKYTIYRHLEEE